MPEPRGQPGSQKLHLATTLDCQLRVEDKRVSKALLRHGGSIVLRLAVSNNVQNLHP